MSRLVRLPVVFATAALLLASCSGTETFSSDGQTATEAAIELIETDDFAQRLGITTMTDVLCEEPASQQEGSVFACTADSEGKTVVLRVTIEGEERVFASPRNVVTRDLIRDYASDAVGLLNQANGFDFPDGAIDCGSQGVVLELDSTMTCVLTDPESGVQFDAVIAVNPETAALSVVVGEPIE